VQFDKVLRQRHVIALAFGAMIGWSWVLMSGLWIGRAGTLGAVLPSCSPAAPCCWSH